ncbi:hypothetical protein [Halobacteriovorax sp.]|uniref:hypothetical protein n=1 Tax=Halobacteriovorax sp. TaxID=2020862 RepID=UPI003AF2C984
MQKATKLRIVIKRDGKEKANIKLPIYSLKHIETLMPDVALVKLKERNIDLESIVKKVKDSDYSPQTLFEINDPKKSYRVWIE